MGTIHYIRGVTPSGWIAVTQIASGTMPMISLSQDGYVYVCYENVSEADLFATRKLLTGSVWDGSWSVAPNANNFATQWAYYPVGNINKFNEPLWGASAIIEISSAVYYAKIDGVELDSGFANSERGAVISGSL